MIQWYKSRPKGRAKGGPAFSTLQILWARGQTSVATAIITAWKSVRKDDLIEGRDNCSPGTDYAEVIASATVLLEDWEPPWLLR